jgi:hypothetical protein
MDLDDCLHCHAGPDPAYDQHGLAGPRKFLTHHERHYRRLPLLAKALAVVVIFTRPARLPLWVSLMFAALDLLIIMATVPREAPLHAQLDREGEHRSAHSPTGAWQLDSHPALDAACALFAGVDGAVAFGGE